jgi:hypothetical protein
MKLIIRVVIPALLLAAGGVALARSNLLAEVGLDLWSTSAQAEERDLRSEEERIDNKLKHADRRSRIKEFIAQDVIDGRTSLFEAADQFLALNEAAPALVAPMRERFPAATDRECAALQVMSYIKANLHSKTGRFDELFRRLDQELRVLRDGSGTRSN